MERTEIVTGKRVVNGTEFAVVKRVRRDQRPGHRPTWILETLCNGSAELATEYRNRREATAAMER